MMFVNPQTYIDAAYGFSAALLGLGLLRDLLRLRASIRAHLED